MLFKNLYNKKSASVTCNTGFYTSGVTCPASGAINVNLGGTTYHAIY
ncbi:MAG: hypothetical protein IKA08_03365 [Alphaproteobacteria bacterium]|nr:hypothetical protein [Alphaproteobacteria bacterium]